MEQKIKQNLTAVHFFFRFHETPLFAATGPVGELLHSCENKQAAEFPGEKPTTPAEKEVTGADNRRGG